MSIKAHQKPMKPHEVTTAAKPHPSGQTDFSGVAGGGAAGAQGVVDSWRAIKKGGTWP